MRGITQRIRRTEKATKAVSKKHEGFVQANADPPLFDHVDHLFFGLAVIKAEDRPTATSESGQIDRVDRSISAQTIEIQTPQGNATTETMHKNERSVRRCDVRPSRPDLLRAVQNWDVPAVKLGFDAFENSSLRTFELFRTRLVPCQPPEGVDGRETAEADRDSEFNVTDSDYLRMATRR